ncbi:MAG: Holliday junction branch migration protein RuvA [Epsilonproteobacteria bacterium]|nr:Holliday junction branch migration protein RuvA [Campylobacterota bacterium]
MIVGIEGKVVYKEPTEVNIAVGGVVYQLFTPLNNSLEVGERVYLYTTLIVREDSHSLYGFERREEKKLFDKLIKVSGIGPKVALAILSTFTPAEFIEIVKEKDIEALKKVPGIGTKSAQRLLLELDKLEIAQSDDNYKEVYLALESLGFKKEKIQKALKAIKEAKSKTTAELVKEVLKIIQKM